MAITVREEQDAAMASTANPTFTTGAGMLTTDKLVVIHSNDFYSAANLTAPTGTAGTAWSLAATVDAGSNLAHTKVWTSDVALAGARTVIINSTTTDEERFAALFVLTGAASGIDGSAGTANGASSTSIVAPTVTPTSGQTDDLLICAFLTGFQGGGTAVNLTMPGSMTPYTERDVGAFCTARLGSEQLASAAATGTRTATASAAQSYQSLSVLIKSAAAAAPAVLWPRRRGPNYRR